MFENHNFRVMETSQSRSFMQRVYGWMVAALGVSAFTAYMVGTSPELVSLFYGNLSISIILFVAYMGLGVYFSARLNHMGYSQGIAVYLLYAAVCGIM